MQFVLRHYNFLALMRPGNAYTELLSSADFAMMPWLRKFQVSPKELQLHTMPFAAATLRLCSLTACKPWCKR